MTGHLLVVVGPSGVGKDSLIGHARASLAADPAILFVRRAVTRPADAAAEDHDSLTEEAFAEGERAGAFAVTWQAHGLRYGVPAAAKRHVEAGGIAVLNGSRAALPAILAGFPDVTVASIVARPEVIAARLAARGRETETQIRSRLLRRATPELPSRCRLVEIDNSGPLQEGGGRLLDLIRSLRPDPANDGVT